ncbi:MAG: lycopene cyclase family protein [Trueperaceae bacterium]|nr:lycopene cyclase family protein [Trueperaceae bacterium]
MPTRTVNTTFDVLVVGAGPAGLSLVAHLAEQGLSVGCLAPNGLEPWPNTYGVWVDEIEPLGYTDMLEHRWSDVRAHFGDRPLRLERSYGCFDNAKLQRHFCEQSERGDVTWLRGRAQHVTHTGAYSELTDDHERRYRARLIVDTSGHFPVLVERPKSDPAFQAAYGVTGRFSAPPVEPGSMMLMDYRDGFLSDAEKREPTFLYAMDLGDGRFFVEETSLARRPGLELSVLKDRLERRLAHYGVTILEVDEVERCLFPMGLEPPLKTQRVVGFGGAASMVHPASGYLVAATLRLAPVLARTIAEQLGRDEAEMSQVAKAAWQTVWPEANLRQRALYRFGLEALLGFDTDQLQHFFQAFFRLPPHLWQGYLGGTLARPALANAMLGVFRHASFPVRGALTRRALSPDRRWLLRALR